MRNLVLRLTYATTLLFLSATVDAQTAWSRLNPPTGPGARSDSAMVFHATRGVVILSGGWNGTTDLADTWEWNGSTWRQLSPATSPGRHSSHRLVHDTGRDRIVRFGGWDVSTLRDDTWEWDGVDWALRRPPVSPPARSSAAMCYDTERGRTVLFGGFGGFYLRDTWDWDGRDWVRRTAGTGPAGRGFAAIAYDGARDRTLLFGGGAGPLLGDMWEYQTGSVATAMPYGRGCAGSAGVPQIAAAARPWVGETLDLQLSRLSPAAPSAFLGLGTSRTQWGALTLPHDLSGMPGCEVLAALEIVVVLQPVAGAASWPLPLPSISALVGQSIYMQGFVVDPVNALGLVATSGLAHILGAK